MEATAFVLHAPVAGFATIVLCGALNAVAPMFPSALVVYGAY